MKTKKLFPLIIPLLGAILISMNLIDDGGWDVPAKYKEMENPYANAEDKNNTGEDLYERHCTQCHGEEGYGDGKKAARLNTPMRDLTSEEVQSQSDGVLYYKSVVGRDEMPNFEKKIRYEKDQWLLVNYIKSLDE